MAQSIFEYHVPAAIFPIETHYVALGHLHRRQELPAAAPVHYSGAPLPVDFGEEDNTPVVVLVETAAGQAREGHRPAHHRRAAAADCGGDRGAAACPGGCGR